jgi:hypothetical protein
MARKKSPRKPILQRAKVLDDVERADLDRRSKLVKKGDFRGTEGDTWIGCTRPIESGEDDDD